MRMASKMLYGIAAMTAFALGGIAHAQPSAPDASARATSASDYVMKAGAGDQYEIQSSKLVLSSTKDPTLKGFANHMIRDHTKSTAMVT